MECLVCNSGMNYFFSKEFNYLSLGIADYYKCDNCGFAASKTHYELSNEDWTQINLKFHQDHNQRSDNPYNRNQRYFNQALMISMLSNYNLIEGDKFLDWASGDGTVSLLSEKLFNKRLYNYDKYITPKTNVIKEEDLIKGDFDLVINCALFEHVTTIDVLNDIESLVKSDGVFGIHTLVPEEIPCDSNWMYLLPVHCSFYTNRSMQILMDKWGYKSSVYNEHSKLWLLFKKDFREIESKVNQINEILGWDYLKAKSGFMDYWK